MKQTYVVMKPFSAEEIGGELTQPGKPFIPRDSTRAADLERLGLIRRVMPKAITAPQNKTLSLPKREK